MQEHDSEACGKCTFVAGVDFIVVTPQQRRDCEVSFGTQFKAWLRLVDLEDYIVRLGTFTLPRWPGHATFWLFQCPRCGQQSIDHVHSNRPRFTCSGCESWLYVANKRFLDT